MTHHRRRLNQATKIAGVRELIRKYSPLQEFDRTEAIRIVGNQDPTTGAPRFADYEDLFIEERGWSTKLKPEDVFNYLLERGVFRVGLNLTCTTCELPFWVSIDDASVSSKHAIGNIDGPAYLEWTTTRKAVFLSH